MKCRVKKIYFTTLLRPHGSNLNFFFLTWKLLAELAHSVPPFFPFFYCLEQRTILSIYYRLDLTIISEGLKHFLCLRKEWKVGFLSCARQRPKTVIWEETQLFSNWKKDIPCQAWGGIGYERHMPVYPTVRECHQNQYWQGMPISWWVRQMIFIPEDSLFPVINNGAK